MQRTTHFHTKLIEVIKTWKFTETFSKILFDSKSRSSTDILSDTDTFILILLDCLFGIIVFLRLKSQLSDFFLLRSLKAFKAKAYAFTFVQFKCDFLTTIYCILGESSYLAGGKYKHLLGVVPEVSK